VGRNPLIRTLNHLSSVNETGMSGKPKTENIAEQEKDDLNAMRRLQQSVEIDIKNYQNIQYYGYLYLGTP
jgi:hypothetical protein